MSGCANVLHYVKQCHIVPEPLYVLPRPLKGGGGGWVWFVGRARHT